MDSRLDVATQPIARQQTLSSQHHIPIPEYSSLLTQAQAYYALFYREHGAPASLPARLHEIYQEVTQKNSYTHSYDELAYGARVAWRNSARCIGRLYWKSLTVRDMRHLNRVDEVFETLVEHLRQATNQGKIRPTLTVLAPQRRGEPGIRIWNSQLIRYAGYRQSDGSILGDPGNTRLTDYALQLGWRPRQQTPFDVLPLIIQMPYKPPRLFELPADAILEVPISHPHYAWFEQLGLKWHALPVISNMRLEIGGISYTAAPFNGWYMGSEIGARNFADLHRYNLLPVIAKQLGLDTSHDRTLWKDRALVELNIAVLHSFHTHGVSIVDHHTASRQFVVHEENELQQGHPFSADWGWIVPPLSGSVTPVFHHHYHHFTQTPNYFSQPDPLQDPEEYRHYYTSRRHEHKATTCPHSNTKI